MFSLSVVSFFSFHFLWLTSSFMPLWSEKVLETISTFFNLLRLVLCPSMWYILENVPWALEKNIYSDFFFFLDVMSWKYQLNLTFLLSFRITVALLIFLSRGFVHYEWGIMSPTFIIFPSISPFMSVSICRIYLGTYILTIVNALLELILLSLVSFFVFLYSLCFKVYFFCYEYCNSHFPVFSICMKSFSIPSFSIYVCPLS